MHTHLQRLILQKIIIALVCAVFVFPCSLKADVIINEVLARQLVGGANHDEFIELYNNGPAAVDIQGWVLDDRETNSISTFSFPAGSLMQAGDYFVIWVGNNIPANNAPSAAQQFYLGLTNKLANTADDILLEDNLGNPIDYIAWGTGGSIDPPPAGITWDTAQQTYLDNTSAGQSISLTPNGVDSDTSVCWERTTGPINPGSASCANYTTTLDRDATRTASPGEANNFSADLSVSKTDNTSTYTPGDTGIYIITVMNAGPDDVSAATLTDNLPNGLSFNGAISCTPVANCSLPTPNPPLGQSLTIPIDIASGVTVTVNVPVIYSIDDNDYMP